MNENYRCGDPEGLIAFVYGECDPDEREAIAAHVAACPACTEEIESLRSTRTILTAWTPPETSLGFRITRGSEVPGSLFQVPGSPNPELGTRNAEPVWWRQPLPAWAQAAAAVLIFAAGMTAGGARQQQPASTIAVQSAPTSAQSAPTSAQAPSPATRPVSTAAAVSRDDLIRLEQRLSAMETARRQAAARPVAGSVDEAALMRRVEAIVTASEQRQRIENATLVEDVARNIAAWRQRDLKAIDGQMRQLHSTTDATLKQHNTAINSLVRNVSLPQSVR